MLYCSEISPTRCNNWVFVFRNGFTLHVSGDNLTHHQEYICCIWPNKMQQLNSVLCSDVVGFELTQNIADGATAGLAWTNPVDDRIFPYVQQLSYVTQCIL